MAYQSTPHSEIYCYKEQPDSEKKVPNSDSAELPSKAAGILEGMMYSICKDSSRLNILGNLGFHSGHLDDEEFITWPVVEEVMGIAGLKPHKPDMVVAMVTSPFKITKEYLQPLDEMMEGIGMEPFQAVPRYS